MDLWRKFQQILPRSSLLTIYKFFIRSLLDYADIIYDQAYNSIFHDKLESVQYNACLAITGTIRGTSAKKLYLELGLESLNSRRTQYDTQWKKSKQKLCAWISNSVVVVGISKEQVSKNSWLVKKRNYSRKGDGDGKHWARKQPLYITGNFWIC